MTKPTIVFRIPEKVYTLPVEDLNFSARAFNVLKRNNLNKVEDILDVNENLSALRNCGTKTVVEIRNTIINHVICEKLNG